LCWRGWGFGLIAAVLAQKLDPKVYIAADVEQVLGFRTAGAVAGLQ
jgi:hypothetical protein